MNGIDGSGLLTARSLTVAALTVVLWTARLAAGCYLARVALRLARPGKVPSFPECLLWTAGAALLLLHVAAAFHLVHHWSQSSAWEATARQTAKVYGVNWGGGVVINELFLLLWSADAARLWRERRVGRRLAPLWWSWLVHLTFAVLMVNATAVFGSRGWIPVIASVGIASLALRWYARSVPPVETEPL